MEDMGIQKNNQFFLCYFAINKYLANTACQVYNAFGKVSVAVNTYYKNDNKIGSTRSRGDKYSAFLFRWIWACSLTQRNQVCLYSKCMPVNN